MRDEYPVRPLPLVIKDLSPLIGSPLQTKKITIVHGHTLVLNPTYSVKFRQMVGAQFKARNIDLVLNDIVETFPESDSGEVVLKSGQKIHAGLIVSLFAQMQPDCFQLSLSIRYEHRDRDQTLNSLRHPLARTSLLSRNMFMSPPSSRSSATHRCLLLATL